MFVETNYISFHLFFTNANMGLFTVIEIVQIVQIVQILFLLAMFAFGGVCVGASVDAPLPLQLTSSSSAPPSTASSVETAAPPSAASSA